MFFFHDFELEILVGVPVPGVNSLHQIEEDQLVLSQARQYMSNNRLYTPYSLLASDSTSFRLHFQYYNLKFQLWTF